MTDDEKQRLRELAGKATPGPWSQVDTPWGDGTWVCTGTGDPHGQMPVADCEMHCHEDEYDSQPRVHENAAFVAAANPSVVIALLDENQRLRALIKRIDEMLHIPAAEYVPAIADVFALIDRSK